MNEISLEDFINYLEVNYGEENWVPVYKQLSSENHSEDGRFYCALVSLEKTPTAMQQSSWDIMIGTGGPGFSTYCEDGESITNYHEQSDEDYRHIVLCRDFHGRKDNYIEISEEFRLLHNLYWNQKTSKLIAFDECGDEVEVVKITPEEILIRKSYLKAFMAAKQMNLLLYFEVTRHFNDNINFTEEKQTEDICYSKYSGRSYAKGYSVFTRILGKKLIRCGSIDACGIWPFEQPKRYETFIIGGDVDFPEYFTCNPEKLANYFGANPDAPHYLTPVFFSKEVMQKYYGSSNYEIIDGQLSRNGAWSLRFDNNSSTHISVFLGDLGRDLPSKEQTYWKSFNLVPDKHQISETNFQRNILGNFFHPTSPDLQFKSAFKNLEVAWREKFSWDLFLPLEEKDQHFYHAIRSMLSNEQSEFDAQILALTKSTIDSVNIKALRTYLNESDPDKKSIALLEMLFAKMGIADAAKHTTFLRGIQSVRSTGVAHRKGTGYDRVIAKLNINDDNYCAEFDEILRGFVILFDNLRTH